METRMKSAAGILPEAMTGIQAMLKAVFTAGVPRKTLGLVHTRVSQINGCAACLESGLQSAKNDGESDLRLMTVAGWRHSPHFTEAERAALALAEAMTRLADSNDDPVPDSIWNDAAQHFEEKPLAGLLLWISLTNLFNRLNVTTRQAVPTW